VEPLPADLAADETAAFLAPLLPPSARVLEIGCGDGRVAARLAAAGFRVLGIDTDEEEIALAQQRGVEARVADALEIGGGPFDAIAFTRSLHHIERLDAALDRARGLLAPGGRLLAEEFARESADAATARWFYGHVDRLDAAGLIETDEEDSMAEDPLERWIGDHEVCLHPGAELRRAFAARFSDVETVSAPYLFRYFCGRLEESPRGAAISREILEEERREIATRRIVAVGLRITARRA
jgi:SAM-dependent methyltransferase